MFNLGVSAMKKSLIALAAVAATGAAMAQSSVTLYGVADVGVGQIGDKGTDKSSYDTTTGALANSNLNNGNSRIGFRGVEDLGNGLKASFQFEQAVSLADGASSGFQRQAWAGLSGGFGALRAGRQNTPSYFGIASWELTGAANYSANGLVFGYGNGGSSRDNALIQYISPSVAGFKLHAGYIFEDQYKTDRDSKGKYDLALIYQNGPVAAAVTYNYAEFFDGPTTTTWSKKGRNENASIGGSYDFGVAKLAASYNYNDTDRLEGYSVGVAVPLGNFSLAVDAVYAETRDHLTSTGWTNLNQDGVDVVVEAKYALSKRTFVYGVYYRADEDGPKFGQHFTDENNFGIGLRHNF